jgi:hypothetical protein
LADLSEIDLAVDVSVALSTPVHYGGVRMRSKLEQSWARHFDAEHIFYQYEPESFGLGRYRYRRRERYDEGYVPDFAIYVSNGTEWKWVYAEVKPDGDAFRKSRRFAAEFDEPILCLEGTPRHGPIKMLYGRDEAINVELRGATLRMVSR